MATSKAQRAGIWVIAIVLTIGTLAGFVAMILAPQNQTTDQAKAQEELLAQYKQEQSVSNEPLDGYKSAAFDGSSVDTLKVDYKKRTNGDKVKASDTISANYFGWDASGAIFDSTNKKDAEPTPIEFPLDGVIEGWTKGLSGVPVGSTVELTIPGDMAYGNKDNGDGRPVGPLKFVVTIEKVVKK